jgi:hypothetical protein
MLLVGFSLLFVPSREWFLFLKGNDLFISLTLCCGVRKEPCHQLKVPIARRAYSKFQTSISFVGGRWPRGELTAVLFTRNNKSFYSSTKLLLFVHLSPAYFQA